jgi:hypothetical protein
MPAARFDHAGGSVLFGRHPLRPAGGIDLLQAEARATGGTRYGYDPHAIERPLTLQWSGMASADLAALEIFLAQVVKGMAELFTYTDFAGVVHTVRCATAQLNSTEIAFGRHNVTLDLLESA